MIVGIIVAIEDNITSTPVAESSDSNQEEASSDPNQEKATTLYSRGVFYFNEKDYDSAITQFNEAIRLIPNFYGAYQFRADSYRRKGQYDAAIRDLDIAIGIVDYADA